MTITYYQRSTDRLAGNVIADHEDALELTTGSAVTESSTIPFFGSATAWAFSTPADNPNVADWPNGTYRCQLDVTAAGGDTTYGCGFARVDAALATTLESVTQVETAFAGTGLKLATKSWNPAAGSATDRFQVTVSSDNTGPDDQLLSCRLDTIDSYADGPWEGSTPAGPPWPLALQQRMIR